VTDPVRRAIDSRVPWAAHDEFFFHQAFGAGPALTQGWKLHVSATPLSAVEVLDAALGVLLAAGARFKVVKSIQVTDVGISTGFPQAWKTWGRDQTVCRLNEPPSRTKRPESP
jgi:hypothetical protein